MAESTLEQVEQLADQLSIEEQISLVEYLARRVRLTMQPHPPQDLYGVWRDRFPKSFDADKALKEIRGEWNRE